MKKSEVVYLSALVVLAPQMHQGVAMIMGGIMTMLAVAFDVMERK
jgi:predicted phage tail protein